MSKQHLKFLDGLRGLAALYVLVAHARWLLWEGYSEGYVQHPEAYPLPAKLLMYFFSTFRYGHAAVMLFFVLSGFVIHLRYAKQLNAQPDSAHFDWIPFVVRRFRRLYPPLLFAILLTLVLDSLGAALGFPIYFQQTAYPLVNANVTSSHDLSRLFEALFLIPESGDWGTNGPLWSLKYEWWFYMIYPLLWMISKVSIKAATGVMVAAFCLSFLLVSDWLTPARVIFSSMIVWWLGALLADIYSGRLKVSLWLVSLLIVLLPFGIFVSEWVSQTSTAVPDALIDVVWGLGFMGLIAACLGWQRRGGSLKLLEWFKPIGDFSYSLYITHFPILAFISGYLLTQAPLLPRYFEWVFIGSAISILFAYGVHFVVERPFLSESRLVIRLGRT